ncbi:MAG: thiamine phosphate synthase [Acidobacteriota bacterium]
MLAITEPTLPPAEVGAWVEAMADAGVDAVQVRLHDRTDHELWRAGRAAVAASAGRLRVSINGRADLAIAVGADGVHLPSAGVAPERLAHQWPELVLGLSTHDADEVSAVRALAAAGRLDYVTFGPFAASPSKAAYGLPPGPAGLRRAAAHGVPVLALGGIDPSRVDAAREAGAVGVAAIRACRDADAARRLVDAVRLAFPAGAPAHVSAITARPEPA